MYDARYLELMFFGFGPFAWERRSRKSILVIEDDLSLKPILTGIFGAIDGKSELTWVATAEEGLAALACGTFDLVITDYFLEGGGTGMDVWEYCKKNHAGLPVLMVSGLSHEEIQRRAGGEVCEFPFLEKPLEVDPCRVLLEQLLEGWPGGKDISMN